MLAPLGSDVQDRSPLQARRIAHIVRHWASLAAEQPAIWEHGVAISFGGLAQLIDSARDLLASHGVLSGDRVMIVAENCAAEVAVFFAASELQAWPVILNARMSPREIDVIRDHCRPRITIFTAQVSPDAAAHAQRASATVLAQGPLAGVAMGLPDTSSVRERDDSVADVATLIYTSGTTGAPKGVMVTHRGLLHFCAVSSRSRRLGPSDRVYAALPLSHIFGVATVVLATLYARASIYLAPTFSPERTVDALNSANISILQGVPMMFRRLLTHMSHAGQPRKFAHLRYLYTGGGSLEPRLKMQVEQMFSLPLHHGYGMTEYAGSMFVTAIDEPRRDCSAGYLNPGCAVRIVGSNGREVAGGEPGEIEVRGAVTMAGYYRAPDLTREVLSDDGWLHTGDIGKIGADGALTVVGRSKDLFKRSGFNVYPIEVESVLNQFPGVKASAVVGLVQHDGNEEVVVFIEWESRVQCDLDGIAAFARDQLAPYKRPGQYRYIDALPVNSNGKILKHQLRAQVNES